MRGDADLAERPSSHPPFGSRASFFSIKASAPLSIAICKQGETACAANILLIAAPKCAA